MAHPFEKILSRALTQCEPELNAVLREAEKLREKGYAPTEIHSVLRKMKISRIDETEELLLDEAVKAFELYIAD